MSEETLMSIATLAINAVVAVIVFVMRKDVQVVHQNVNSNFQVMRTELNSANTKIGALEEIIRGLKSGNAGD